MRNTGTPTVYIIDDDPAMRDSTQWLLESVGLNAMSFSNGQDFFDSADQITGGCILLDVRMPGMSGINVQQMLPDYNIDLPVIIVTGHGDVPMAVSAMKHGAVDFIEKPFNDQHLLDCVHTALDVHKRKQVSDKSLNGIRQHFDTLSPRETEVMKLVVKGLPNKTIANMLDLSRKTVEVHRARVMDKVQADTLSDLIRMALAIGHLDKYTSREN